MPAEGVDATRDAVFSAGAGRIGFYERCSFISEGIGTFYGGLGTSPAIGESGREERFPELRVEVVVPAEALKRVVEALIEAHPYEEVAYDLFALAEPPL